MHTYKFLFYSLIAIFLISCGQKTNTETTSAEKENSEFVPLFNGADLTGWETYIGVPEPSVDVPELLKNEEGKYTEPLGLNNDPIGVFTVVEADGEPAVRASGEIYGSLATKKEFENYHFKMQVKWGEAKWAPRADKPRNSGLLYHGTGEYGVGLGVWKTSHECQVMENMFGDSYRMGDSYCNVKASVPEGEERYIYTPDAEEVEFGEGKKGGKICFKSSMNEKPLGEWNTVEIICFKDISIHIINGVVNMVNSNSHLEVDGQVISLTKGNIQLQSEGAEVFFRKMEIKEITEIPDNFLN